MVWIMGKEMRRVGALSRIWGISLRYGGARRRQKMRGEMRGATHRHDDGAES